MAALSRPKDTSTQNSCKASMSINKNTLSFLRVTTIILRLSNSCSKLQTGASICPWNQQTLITKVLIVGIKGLMRGEPVASAATSSQRWVWWMKWRRLQKVSLIGFSEVTSTWLARLPLVTFIRLWTMTSPSFNLSVSFTWLEEKTKLTLNVTKGISQSTKMVMMIRRSC